MRVVHTSDWHIGRSLFDISMLADQRVWLDRFIRRLDELHADALIIAGDLYDRAIPPAEGVTLLNDAFNQIVADLGIPVFAIAGNHDSPLRLEFGSRLCRESGLYLESRYNGRISKFTLEDEYGPVNFYLLPYLEPELLRLMFKEEGLRTANELFGAVLERELPEIRAEERNLLIAHGFFCSGDAVPFLSDSETGVGGSDAVDLGPAAIFDYLALGHLHRPQTAGLPNAHYSGSMLKYSIAEQHQQKGILVADLYEKGRLEVTQESIPALHDVRQIKGCYPELLEAGRLDPHADDYLFAILQDEGLIPEAMNGLRAVYPNLLGLRFEVLERENVMLAERTLESGRSLPELFRDFYEEVKGEEITPARARLLDLIYERLGEGDRL